MGILSSITRTLGGGGRRSSRPTIGAYVGRSPGFGRQARSQQRRSSGLGGALLGTLGGLALRELSRRGTGARRAGAAPVRTAAASGPRPGPRAASAPACWAGCSAGPSPPAAGPVPPADARRAGAEPWAAASDRCAGAESPLNGITAERTRDGAGTDGSVPAPWSWWAGGVPEASAPRLSRDRRRGPG